MSDLRPDIAGIADELCFIKTMNTEHVNHDPAAKFLHTGFQLSGRPSIGPWASYALGSDNTNLPAFVVMTRAPPGVCRSTRTCGPPASCRRTIRVSGSEPMPTPCSTCAIPPA